MHPAEAVAAQLERVEATMHRFGWDEPPMFCAAYRKQDDDPKFPADNTATWSGPPEPLVVDDLVLHSIVPKPLWALYPDPYALVRQSADGLHPDTGPDMMASFRRELAGDDFTGMLFCAEAHALFAPLAERKKFRGPLSSHPQAEEQRFVLFADSSGTMHYTYRNRSTDKVESWWATADGTYSGDHAWVGTHGRFAEVLRQHVDIIHAELDRPPLSPIPDPPEGTPPVR